MNAQYAREMPTIEVYRSIAPDALVHQGIQTLGDILAEQALADPDIDAEEAHVARVFRPAHVPRAILLGASELRDFHADIGVTPSVKQLNALTGFVLDSLATSSQEDIPRLRVAEFVYIRSRRSGIPHYLDGIIAGGSMTPERRKAIRAVGEFHGVDVRGTALGGFQSDIRARLAAGRKALPGWIMRRMVKHEPQRLAALPRLTASPIETRFYESRPL